MTLLTKTGEIRVDMWRVLRENDNDSTAALSPNELVEKITITATLIPLSLWAKHREILQNTSASQVTYPRGVWLGAEVLTSADTKIAKPQDAKPLLAVLQQDLNLFDVIAIDFPKFSDGRGYSLATLIRQRLNYRGELRAIGDVLRDQLFYLARVGFDTFAVRDDVNIEDAARGLSDFSVRYQRAHDVTQPLFARTPR